MKYTIVAKENEISFEITKQLEEKLSFLEYSEKNPDLIICVGGDGTILHALHQYLNIIDKVKFVGIHTGTLGFFTDYTKDEIDEFVEDVKRNQYTISKANLLEIKVYENNCPSIYYALNEMRIENILRTQKLAIYIDDEYFETVTGTGVCICTQAGSTAVNRALKGAVVDDGIQLLQMSEIAGIHHHYSHSLGNPYIMRCDRKIKICSENFKDAVLCYDQKHMLLDTIDKIECTTSEKKVQFIRFRPYSYLKRLKNLY